MSQVEVVLWWHHHQPWYLDPRSGQARLPWVRLHACRGYLDMASAAMDSSAEHVRHTFNLVPSLLDQLARYAKPGATDSWLELSRPHPADMDAASVAELVHRMGGGGPTPVRTLPRLEVLRRRVAQGDSLGVDELLDLQVLAHLGFCGWTLAERAGPARDLFQKGSGFTQQEKLALLDQTVRACDEVIQAYASLARDGRAEITATPYFHPILPLLVDSDSMAEGLPGSPRPPRFQFPDDARMQVVQGLARVQELLGVRPRGMWPAEGSVSTEAVRLLGDCGVTFCASDESVLRRSTSTDGLLLDHGQPWVDPSGKVSMFFRDHHVSDLLGFSYRHMSPDAAAADLLARARAFGAQRKGHGRPPVMVVILDGENPWEHYPVAGRDHLLAIQRALGNATDVSVVTPSDHLARHPATARLSRVHAGSWIDGTFRIWIGHEEDRRGWRLLGDARRAIQRAADNGADPARVAAALQNLYAAEGSDWFWWLGDEFQAREADLYDALFRDQVRRAWEELGVTPPPNLSEPIKQSASVPAAARAARGWPVDPALDGGAPSALDWDGAVRVTAGKEGAMARASGPVAEVLLGATPDSLWVNVAFRGEVPAGKLAVVLAGTHHGRVEVSLPGGIVTESGALAVVGTHLTVQWPLDVAGVLPGDNVALRVELTTAEGSQAVPGQGDVHVEVPDASERWRAAWA